MKKETKEKITKIMELALEINGREKNTVLIYFFGNCDSIDIRIFYNGWKDNIEADFKRDISLKYEEEKLEEVIKKLEELKGE